MDERWPRYRTSNAEMLIGIDFFPHSNAVAHLFRGEFTVDLRGCTGAAWTSTMSCQPINYFARCCTVRKTNNDSFFVP
jgi:hypothetical protein